MRPLSRLQKNPLHREVIGLTLWLKQSPPHRWALTAALLAVIDLLLLPWALWGDPTVLFWADKSRAEWAMLNFAAGLAVVSWWSRRKPVHKAPDDASQYGSHGSTRWAHPGELRTHLKRDGPGLILGKAADGLLILPPDPTLPLNQNVTVLGSSGTKKTRSFVQPNLLQEAEHRNASIICVDPKGVRRASAQD